MGWFFVKIWIVVGIVFVGIKVELMNGKNMSG